MKTKSIYKSIAGREKIKAIYNKVLSQWPVPCDSVNIPTRYGNTFVIASGDTLLPPMILIHGTASNSAMWANDIIEYSKSFRVYCVDIPGEPGGSDENRFSWTGTAFVEWLDDVLAGLNVSKAVIGGMSLGAWATLKYAIFKPERVEKAVLICPSGICQARLSVVFRLIVFSFLGNWGLQRMKKLIFKNAQLSEDVEEFFLLTSKYFKFRIGSPPLFTDGELKGLKMPILYLAGEGDALLQSGKSAERLQKLVPDVTTNLVKDEGHATINMASLVISFLGDEVCV